LIFVIPFIIAYFLVYVRKGNIRQTLEKSIIFGLGALILFLPRFIQVFSGRILQILGIQLSTSANQVNPNTLQYNAIGDLLSYLPAILWIMLPILLVWGLWRRSRPIAIIGLWWFLVFLLANPELLKLPGTGAINNFTVLISLYIPVSIIVSAGLIWLFFDLKTVLNERLDIQSRRKLLATQIPNIIIFMLLTLITILGAQQRINDIQIQNYSLLTRPDIRAVNWIEENISDSSIFLVNSFSAFGGAAIVGTDGGWWLPLLANINSTQPPINYTMEKGPFPDYQQWINTLTEAIRTKGINNPEVLSMLEERKITHVYIGQQQGKVGYVEPSLSPVKLLTSPYYTPIYNHDRVWIFEVDLSPVDRKSAIR
jgi:hypothetical protein